MFFVFSYLSSSIALKAFKCLDGKEWLMDHPECWDRPGKTFTSRLPDFYFSSENADQDHDKSWKLDHAVIREKDSKYSHQKPKAKKSETNLECKRDKYWLMNHPECWGKVQPNKNDRIEIRPLKARNGECKRDKYWLMNHPECWGKVQPR